MDNPTFWDGKGAKVVALIVFLAAGTALVYQDYDLLGPRTAATMTADPGAMKLKDCLAKRGADIDKLVADGLMAADQARVSKARLIPVCQAEVDRA